MLAHTPVPTIILWPICSETGKAFHHVIAVAVLLLERNRIISICSGLSSCPTDLFSPYFLALLVFSSLWTESESCDFNTEARMETNMQSFEL